MVGLLSTSSSKPLALDRGDLFAHIDERSVLLSPPTIDGRAAAFKNQAETNRRAEKRDGEAKCPDLWLPPEHRGRRSSSATQDLISCSFA